MASGGFNLFDPSSWGGAGAVGVGAGGLVAAPFTGGASLAGSTAGMASQMPGPSGGGFDLGYSMGTSTPLQSVPGVNTGAITGVPVQSQGSPGIDYGLNSVWDRLSAAAGQPGAPMASAAQLGGAPQAGAALGAAASGTAGQGVSATMTPAQAQAALASYATMRAAQMAGPAFSQNQQIGTAGDASFMGQQQQLANILGAQAQGQGVSAADLQLQQGAQNNIAQQLAVLGSQRGNIGNAALTQRAAADQAAAANAGLNAQMGIQRAQETAAAQQALGSVLGTARGQSQAYNQAQASLNEQTALANAGFAQQTGMLNTNLAQQANAANMAAANANSQFNATNEQQMTLANLANAQQANQFNAGNSQAMTLANLQAQNEFGLANLGNAQAMGLANLGNAQQTNLANLGLAGQYGLQQGQFQQQANLANQSTALANSQLSTQQLAQLLGLGEFQNTQAQNAQQLQLQAILGTQGLNASTLQNNAQARANLWQSLMGAGAGALSLGAMSDKNLKTGIRGGNPMMDSYLRRLSVAHGMEEAASTVRRLGDVYAGREEIGHEADFTLSDDREKEAIMGGNRGMQAFLSQANAQQQAQAGQGATATAFGQDGGPPSAQVDRQMPAPWMPGATGGGYGAPVQPQQTQFGGQLGDAGGVNGTAASAGFSPLSGLQLEQMTNPGGVTSMGGFGNGSVQYGPGMTSTGSVPTMGGVTLPQMPATRPPVQQAPWLPEYGSIGAAFNPANAPVTASGTLGNVQYNPNADLPPPQRGGPPIYRMSDERQKEDVRPSREQLGDLLDQLHAYQYRYRDPNAPGAAPGEHMGVMAQDLEKSALGANAVRDTEHGKMVDYGQLAGTQMAALAYLNDEKNEHAERLAHLESLLAGPKGSMRDAA